MNKGMRFEPEVRSAGESKIAALSKQFATERLHKTADCPRAERVPNIYDTLATMDRELRMIDAEAAGQRAARAAAQKRRATVSQEAELLRGSVGL